MVLERRRATYEDLLGVPEGKVAEIIDGELFVSPRPATPHARATSVISREIGWFDGGSGSLPEPGGWWLLVEPELHFGADVLVPDLAGWRRERMATIPDAPAITLAPGWVCEVISPSTGRLDRSRKMGVYGREGVAWLWLVDPLAHTIEIYRLESGRWVVADTFGGWEVVRAQPFDAIELQPGRWWLDPAPEPPPR